MSVTLELISSSIKRGAFLLYNNVMIIEFKQRPYINLGANKVELIAGDYVLNNGVSNQFIATNIKHNFRPYTSYGNGCLYKVSKSELNRLLNEYDFKIETSCYIDHPYGGEINTRQF